METDLTNGGWTPYRNWDSVYGNGSPTRGLGARIAGYRSAAEWQAATDEANRKMAARPEYPSNYREDQGTVSRIWQDVKNFFTMN